MLHHSRRFCFSALCLTLLFGLPGLGVAFGQEAEPKQPILRIEHIEFKVEGRTRERVISRLVDMYPGMEFDSEDELTAFIADRTQELRNQRPLAHADITYTAYQVEKGVIPVRVSVNTRDSWNILVLPYFKFDSNDGLLLSLRARDYNFFGTLERLAITLDWENRDMGQAPEDEDAKNNEFSVELEFSLPFNWYEYDWNWKLKTGLGFTGSYQQYAAETELSLDLPGAFDRLWTLSLAQEYFYTTEEDDEDTYYLGTSLGYGTRFELPLQVPVLGRLSYNPRLAVGQRYKVLDEISSGRRGTELSFEHGLSAGRVNWIGNFRQGGRFLLSNSNTFNAYHLDWDRDVSTELRGYSKRFPFGFSGRVGAFLDLDGRDQLADRVRGILRRVGDRDQLRGDYGAFANADIALSLFRLRPVAEAQLAAFVDAGVVANDGRSFDEEKDWKVGAGIEVFGFPLFARALYLRGSLGFDLRRVLDDSSLSGSSKREIFIGLEHHY